jgi:hypothetical protein
MYCIDCLVSCKKNWSLTLLDFKSSIPDSCFVLSGIPPFLIDNTRIRLALDVYHLFDSPIALVSRLFPITALSDLASILL